jgi:hypothetical protein
MYISYLFIILGPGRMGTLLLPLQVYTQAIYSAYNLTIVFINWPSLSLRYIKIPTSIQGCEAETREITLRPKGIRR